MPSKVPYQNPDANLPHEPGPLARLSEAAVAGRPDAPAKKCDTLEVHSEHYWGTGFKRKWCRGLKHRSKLRGMPRAERLQRGRDKGTA